jgi:phosphate transport system ATP-binding protein
LSSRSGAAATTGQGKHSFKVLGVRHAGDPLPPTLPRGQGRLTLVTTDVPATPRIPFLPAALQPTDVLRIDAAQVSPVQARPVQLPSQALPAADALMAGDSSALLVVVGWSVLLVAAAVATVWVRFRTGWWQAWVIGLPVLVTLGLTASDEIAALLPNLLTDSEWRSPDAMTPDAMTTIMPAVPLQAVPAPAELAALEAKSISAWFGERKVLDRVSLYMPAGSVSALIGPSGCGKSTFLRILNRMHELIPSATLAGEVLLSGSDIYDARWKLTDARRAIGMVFQKPNPFPAMSIADNVTAGLKLTGIKASADEKDDLIEECLSKAGLWNEVRDRLRQPGGALSGGQQQRLCIARSLAVRPQVLLMDEPCSALDPTSTRRIEQTIAELAHEVTIVIVTHNMQQAQRVSHQSAFFLAEAGTPGVIVEAGPTEMIFGAPKDSRTSDYVNGRFG